MVNPSHLFLPDSLRRELGRPMGELIEGTIDQTIPVLKSRLIPRSGLLIAVGDVTAQLFVENGFSPDLLVTDGQTKRQKLDEWKDWEGFEILEATCPPAEITIEAWLILQEAITRVSKNQPVHVKIHGEEDLLVLPLLVLLPRESVIVYGQPNKGAVIRVVSEESQNHAKEIMSQMDEL